MGELPEGWVWAELGQIALSVKNGMYVSRPGAEPNGTPILRIGAVRPMRLSLADLRYTGLDWREVLDQAGDAVPGDLLFTRYNGNPEYVGAGARVPEGAPQLAYPDKLIRVRVPSDVVDSRFLTYAWASSQVREQVRGQVKTSAGQAGISGASLKRIKVPVPPLAEQHRIVEALEEQLSRLDAAAASVEQGLRRSQTLLRAVVDSALCSVSDSPKMLLGNVLSEPLRNGHSAKATIDPNGVRTLSLTAVTSGEFSDANTKLTVADRDRVKGLWLEPQDLLIQRSNTPELVGTAALFTGARNWAIFPDLLIRVRLNSRVMPEFVLLELQSKRGRSYFKGRAKGLAGSMPKIDQAAIEGFEISVPALEVQKRIVQCVADERERISRLAAELVKARRRGGSLRNGLLRKAFSGGLVAQDPADEPAATLLDRIAAEREAAKPARKAAKPTARPRKATAAAAKAAPAATPAPSASVQQELFVQ